MAAQDRTAHIGESTSPEVHLQVGAFEARSDEGNIGSGGSTGGTVELPVTRRLAFDVDVQSAAVSKGAPSYAYRTRRTLLAPGVVFRFGRVATYGYVGGGLASEWTRSITRIALSSGDRTPSGQAWREIQPRVFELRHSGAGGMRPYLKAGFAGFPWRRVGVRADVYLAGWHTGARVGLGYRFMTRTP